MITLREITYNLSDTVTLEYLRDLIPKIWEVRGQFILNKFEKYFVDGHREPGEQAFFIEVAGVPVGITGFYEFDESRLGLCWHGVLPQYRRAGLGTVSFGMVKRFAKVAYPQVRIITEIIPEDRRAELEPFFVDFLDFRATDEVLDQNDRSWLAPETKWRVYEARLI